MILLSLFVIFSNSFYLSFSIHSRDHLATILNVTDGCFYNSTSPTLSPSNMPVISSRVLCDVQRTRNTFRDADSLLLCKDNLCHYVDRAYLCIIQYLLSHFYYITYQWFALRFGNHYIAHILHTYKVTANILYLFQIII